MKTLEFEQLNSIKSQVHVFPRCHGAEIFVVFELMPCNWQSPCDNRDFRYFAGDFLIFRT